MINDRIRKIKFIKDCRTFKKDEEIAIRKSLLVLVGINGCGKSTILDCLRDELGAKAGSVYKSTSMKGYLELDKNDKPFDTKYYDFHSGDNKFNGTFGDDMMGQIQAQHSSSGIGSLLQFNNTGIKNMTDGLILLDEPDRGMAPKLQHSFAEMITKMTFFGGNQIIVSTHSTYIMEIAELYGQIYSVEHKRFFDTTEEFIHEHLNLKENPKEK